MEDLVCSGLSFYTRFEVFIYSIPLVISYCKWLLIVFSLWLDYLFMARKHSYMHACMPKSLNFCCRSVTCSD